MAARLGAQQWKTPPDSIGHLRQLFDEHKELRTAYYSLGNYIAAIEVQELLKITPVVMDRFWHSTAAYAIAQAVQDYPDKYKIPLPGDNIFCWPEDLLKPDIVIFLDVSEAVRKERQSRRRNVTMQEGLLNNFEEFRKK